MGYLLLPAKKLVLWCPDRYKPNLDQLVEDWLAAGVKYVGIAGKDASFIEDIIEETGVGDGTNEPSRFMLTANHAGESLQEAIDFVTSLTLEFEGDVEIVVL
ncbi:MAG: hypothetical protein ACO1QB_05255 [Verrucomicrobiales bacterium]